MCFGKSRSVRFLVFLILGWGGKKFFFEIMYERYIVLFSFRFADSYNRVEGLV